MAVLGYVSLAEAKKKTELAARLSLIEELKIPRPAPGNLNGGRYVEVPL